MDFRFLIADDGTRVSAGRIAFWLVLGMSIHFWLLRPADFPPSLTEALMLSLGYEGLKKGVQVWSSRGQVRANEAGQAVGVPHVGRD